MTQKLIAVGGCEFLSEPVEVDEKGPWTLQVTKAGVITHAILMTREGPVILDLNHATPVDLSDTMTIDIEGLAPGLDIVCEHEQAG